MRRTLFAAAALVVTVSVAAQAAEAKPEELLKARQGLFQTVKLQFGPLAAIAKGDAPISPETAAQAANLAALARILPTVFGKGSETLPESKTKADAFVRPEFRQYFDTLASEAGKIEIAAKANDLDGVKAGVAAAGKACKGCHDVFRQE